MTDLLTRPAQAAVPAPEPFAGTVAAGLAVVVAPSTGRFRPLDGYGGSVSVGQLLGHVTGGRGRADEVRSPVDGTVGDLLVRPGQLVARGQGLAWLRRAQVAPVAQVGAA